MLPRKGINIVANILLKDNTLRLKAFINSGSDSNLLDSQCIEQFLINTCPIDAPLVVNGLNGSELARITHQTDSLSLLLAGNHREQIAFHVVVSCPSGPRLTLAPQTQPGDRLGSW